MESRKPTQWIAIQKEATKSRQIERIFCILLNRKIVCVVRQTRFYRFLWRNARVLTIFDTHAFSFQFNIRIHNTLLLSFAWFCFVLEAVFLSENRNPIISLICCAAWMKEKKIRWKRMLLCFFHSISSSPSSILTTSVGWKLNLVTVLSTFSVRSC